MAALSPDQFIVLVDDLSRRVDAAAAAVVLQQMLDGGQVADINDMGQLKHGYPHPPMTALIVAVCQDNVPMVACLLANGAHVQREVYGHTPLMGAVLYWCVAACRLLLAEGADAQCVSTLDSMSAIIPEPMLVRELPQQTAIQMCEVLWDLHGGTNADGIIDVCAVLFAYSAPHEPCGHHGLMRCACVLPAIATECARYERIVRDVAWERRLSSVRAWTVWNSNVGYAQFKF